MLLSVQQILWLLLPALSEAATVTYRVPTSSPSGATTLDPAPVGVSLEFFATPSYFTNVTATNQCLENLKNLSGTWPPIRIGGTTQDRATYDPDTSAYVVYSVAKPEDAPASLTYGPSFLTLAGKYQGSVVLGLNRGKDNITNTIAAAQVAKTSIKNLIAIELGNEPEYWGGGQPIAIKAGTWTPAIDAQSQDLWSTLVGKALDLKNIIQAGNWNEAVPKWGSVELISTQNTTAQEYVKSYSHHNYANQALHNLMSHSNIVGNVARFGPDIAAANAIGKEYVFGETNSQSGGGAATTSPTYGASLWTMDYILQAAVSNIRRLYFHHGTIGACYYCWWGRYSMGSPYYGAYAAATALANGSCISALDDGKSNYAAYVIYDVDKKPLRALLYNSDYYIGNGTRATQNFVLNGILSAGVKAKRLTAPSVLSKVDEGSSPSFGGQQFANETCVVGGTETFEPTTVVNGTATFVIGAAEALVVYLQ